MVPARARAAADNALRQRPKFEGRMTKSGTGSEENRSGVPTVLEDSPSPELVELFRQFEARVDEAVRLIDELRREKQEFEARQDEATRARTEAVQRIDALIDKIDGLL